MKDKPDRPDPYQTAEAQSKANSQAAKDTLKLNSIDQYNTFGSSTFDRNAEGLPTAIRSQLSNQLEGLSQNLQNTGQTQSGFLPTEQFQLFGPQTQQASQQYYDRGAALLEDPFKQQRNDLEVRLDERGLPVGSEARNVAEGNLQRQQALALSDLASQGALRAPELAAFENNQNISNLASTLQLLNSIPKPNQASQASAAIQSTPIAQLINQDYQNQMQDYQNDQAALGGILKTGAQLALAPTTGGGSLIGNFLM